jgi:hypothetical protein
MVNQLQLAPAALAFDTSYLGQIAEDDSSSTIIGCGASVVAGKRRRQLQRATPTTVDGVSNASHAARPSAENGSTYSIGKIRSGRHSMC